MVCLHAVIVDLDTVSGNNVVEVFNFFCGVELSFAEFGGEPHLHESSKGIFGQIVSCAAQNMLAHKTSMSKDVKNPLRGPEIGEGVIHETQGDSWCVGDAKRQRVEHKFSITCSVCACVCVCVCVCIY